MEAISEERRKEMEEEMNRFEQEIALPGGPPGPLHAVAMTHSKAVITTNTFSKVEDQLQKQQATQDGTIEAMAPMQPPPPQVGEVGEDVPSVPQFIPHQVQRGPRTHVRPAMPFSSMNQRCPPPPMPPASLMSGPMPGPMPGPMQGPPMAPPMGPPGPMPMPVAMGMGPPPPGYIPQPMPPMPQPPFVPPMPPPMYQPSQPTQSMPISVQQIPQTTSEKTVIASPAVYAAPPMKSQLSEEALAVVEEPSFQSNGPTKTLVTTISNPPIIIIPPKDKIHISSKSSEPASSEADTSTHSNPNEGMGSKKKDRKKKIVRTAGGSVWEDNSLLEWDPDDFRIFCGDLGNDVTDEVLTRAFSKYNSFIKAKVVRDKRNNKTKGFGFVSFKDPQDFIKAMREMNGKYVGSRPIKLRKSTWKDRNIEIVRKKMKEKEKLGLL